MHFVHDRHLLDQLESVGGQALQLDTWRVSWATRNVLEGGWGAGRWNFASSFEALYMSLSMDGALAEIYYHLSQHPVRSTADKTIHHLKVSTRNTLCLRDQNLLDDLGLGPQSIALTDPLRSQEIGAAAHLLEYDSLLVPSARWRCFNLVAFNEFFNTENIEVVDSSPVNWPAWRESRSKEWDEIIEEQRKERMA